jgi:hypothetical protein
MKNPRPGFGYVLEAFPETLPGGSLAAGTQASRN